tara:strand:+ start:1645 stop:1995 length:351 start_codon:yes stop_codon:yes gene_type:complete
MSFKKRLIYYFFGLSIGCLLVFFITNQKKTRFNYLPHERVIGDFKKKSWEFDDTFNNYDTINFLSNTKIIFSESDVRNDSCSMYKLTKKNNLQLYELVAYNCEEKVYFKRLRFSSK